MAKRLSKIEAPITAKELGEHVGDLKVTSRQREFIKAALRALITAVLQKRLGCKVDI